MYKDLFISLTSLWTRPGKVTLYCSGFCVCVYVCSFGFYVYVCVCVCISVCAQKDLAFLLQLEACPS